ncbi:hypothetical protein HA052_19770 [Chromobacterium haemolyticum]|uniref:Uncharacterized protein n=1 Tax=Chromobacterium fluminis TaxID=3044269 RepID=A0ABX0L8U1_9NEIS|nr:hypothetical protein [Chromobacterium haemolyticum]NHR07433.1 hypothetical protein [Chromobacterium haemolyticum]
MLFLVTKAAPGGLVKGLADTGATTGMGKAFPSYSCAVKMSAFFWHSTHRRSCGSSRKAASCTITTRRLGLDE